MDASPIMVTSTDTPAVNRLNRLNQLIVESLAMEAEEAKDAGALGFMARAMTMATMPHRKIADHSFIRSNGDFTLTVTSLAGRGLPYGSKPRLLLAWLVTEAVKTKSQELVLGRSLSDFMRKIGLSATGGKTGSISPLREQMVRLFSCAISATYSTEDRDRGKIIPIAEEYELWWQPKTIDHKRLWESTLVLNSSFYQEITKRPVPVDLRALRVLQQAPLALDIYIWMTYRLSYLKSKTVIPWQSLQLQFGSSYKVPRQFKAAFRDHLRTVLVVYPEAKVRPTEIGLEMRRSQPHIAR